MSPEDMASDERKEENAKIREHALWDSQRGASKQATTDQFQCGKCRQRKTTYYVRTLSLAPSTALGIMGFCLVTAIHNAADAELNMGTGHVSMAAFTASLHGDCILHVH